MTHTTKIASARSNDFIPTGVANLDAVLGGGLPRGALVLVMGLPGSGKTTLANQIAFTAAQHQRQVLILTALSEPTNKLIGHLKGFDFFDQSLIGGPVQFLSLQTSLSNGLKAVSEQVLSVARDMRADLIVLDGFRGLQGWETNPAAARQFLYDVGTTLSSLGTTTLVTSETDPRDSSFFPESTTADIIIGMHYTLQGVRQWRGLEVVKARGQAPLPGLHALALDRSGASVYPQIEERVAAGADGKGLLGSAGDFGGEASANADLPRATFGLSELDALLDGGIPQSSSAIIAGSSGTGKTLLGLHFALAGALAGERTMFLGFRETYNQLLQKTRSFAIGAEIQQAFAAEKITFLRIPPIKVNADIVINQLLDLIAQTGVRRLVIDSIAELERGVVRGRDPNRLEDFLSALVEALRKLDVTTLITRETNQVLSSTLDFTGDPLSVMAENVILLQQVAYQAQLVRVLSVVKMRFSAHDNSLREFRISAPEGVRVLSLFESGNEVLRGIALRQEAEGGFMARPLSIPPDEQEVFHE